MKRILTLISASLVAVNISATVTLPSIFSDSMVLQRESDVNIWGKAEPGSKVTLTASWDGKRYSTDADSDGNWKTVIRTAEAGGPYSLKISDGRKSSLTLKDIMLGEVWICSGQSNMEMPVKGFSLQRVAESAQTIRDCYAHPDIRIFNVERNDSETLQHECTGEWQYPTPENVANCSAIAYFFGREITDLVGVPVGLVTSYWGGTMIETWMTRESVMDIDGIDKSAVDALEEGTQTGRLFNGMIAPIAGFTAKGFLWYQGESNRRRPLDYSALLCRMIRLWRDAWGEQEMPFIMTQLAQFGYGADDLLILPVLVEQQYKAADAVPLTYVATTTDMDSPRIIHPAHKKECGERMAAIALDHCYGIHGLYGESPRYAGMDVEGNRLTVRFTRLNHLSSWPHEGDTFSWLDKDGKLIDVKGFELAGEDGIFHPATSAGLPGPDRITLQAEGVENPKAVRYAFRNVIECNVVTTYGVPLAPFRSDDWEVTDEMMFGK